jgi:LPXTG-motif cell wall-anchored protein
MVAAALLVLITAGPAHAHDPLFLGEDQTTPEAGPLLPDGTISFALYGEIGGNGDTRGLQVAFEDGDELFLELLVPDGAPENLLGDADLPAATITGPDGSGRVIGAPVRGSFFEPFTATSYLRLGSITDVAVGGIYDIVITGTAPARFTLAVGTRETFGTPVERVEDRVSSFEDLDTALTSWLETPPGEGSGAGEEAQDSASGPESSTTSAAGGDPVEAAAAEGDGSSTTVPSAPSAEKDAAAEADPATGEDGGPWVLIVAGGSILVAIAGAVGWGVVRRRRESGPA